jgi:TonB family protein
VRLAPLLALLLVACGHSPSRRLADLPEDRRMTVWARCASHQQRIRDLAGTAVVADATREFAAYLAHLHDNLRFEDAELAALDAEATERGWRERDRCRPPEEAIFQHPLVLPPLPIERALPRFTAAACAAATQGVVVAAVELDRSGRAVAIEIVRGLPHGLDDAARAAVAASRWAPALLCGRAVAVHYHVTVEFRLPCAAEPGAPLAP